ncbi:MAG: hypothetical protein GX556_10545 [Fibrobacter sp.]|nr:hypothetical protein [Fibrobacter sp.]
MSIATAVYGAEDIKKIIFDEQLIEGKIRRPQLVLIKAEQRPALSPMVLKSLGKNADISSIINDDIIQDSPCKGPFRVEDGRLTNIEP